MSPQIKLGAFIGAIVVLGGMAFGIAKTISDGDEPARNSAGSAGSDDEGGDHGQQAAGGHSGDDRFRVVMNEIDFQTGVKQGLEFQIRRGNEVVSDFEVEGEREMHLILVRHDLTGFKHLHPELGDDGTWRAQAEFATAGPHRAYADFQVDGKRQTIPFDLTVTGEYDPRTLPDPQRTAQVDGYTVSMRASGEGSDKRLSFEVVRDGRPVNDLQNYLGSKGHLVAINARSLDYTHVHPVGAQGNGVTFNADLGDEGDFRLFFQFLHEGKVHTAPLTVRGESDRAARTDGSGEHDAQEQPHPRESEDQHGGTEHPDDGSATEGR